MATNTLNHQQCPSSDDLRRLIRGRLPDARQQQITDHVETCLGCQGRLEHLACDGDSNFTGCVRHIDKADPPQGSAYWKALDGATGALTQPHALDDTSPSGDLKLDFLQPADSPDRLGKLGTFEIIRVIGRGGMGVVLRAFDPCLHRDVAIKILDPQLANNEVARARFCREARAAASVSHDNLVAVYQVDEDEPSGLPFMVMHLVNGESLEQRLKRVGTLSVSEAVRVARDAAAGLAAAHAVGLIHRDIKPGNILIENDTDKVKLTDFGLARAVEETKLTRTGFVAGTPLYMAPEQAIGGEVDARSDLFSLGSVMYESLAGVAPFDAKTPLAVLRRVADEDPKPLARVNPDVPDWLEDLIETLLAKKPGDRLQTAAELADTLTARYTCLVPDAKDTPAEPCPMTRTASRFMGRRRPRTALAVMLAAPFFLGAWAGGLGVWTFGPRREVAVEGTSPAASPPVAAAPAGPAGPEPVATLPGKSGAVWSVAASQGSDVVAVGLEDGQVMLWNLAGGAKLINTIPAHEGPVWSVDLTADGKTLVTASDDGKVKVWDLKGEGTVRYEFKHPTSVRSAALDPSGSMIVTGDRAGVVRVWDVCNGMEPSKTFAHGGVVNAVAFHPDGLTVASASTNKKVILWDITHARKRELVGHTGPVYSVSFSPGGDQLATASWDKTVRIWDTNTTQQIKEPLPAHDEGVWAVDFACCGKVLATAGEDGLVRVWDLEKRVPLAEFSRHKGTVHAVRFVPGGKSLLTGGRDGTLRVWKVKD